MTKFEKGHFKVSEEAKKNTEFNIIKADTSSTPIIKKFEINPIKKAGEGDYSAVKAKYGPLAATDLDKEAKTQKDRRFMLNSLLRDPLSIEQEERRVLEEKVRVRVDALTEETKVVAAERGYQDGFQRGYEEALKKVRSEGAASLEKFDQLLHAFENAKMQIFMANEQFLIELIFRVAKSVILKDLELDRDYIFRITKELVGRVGIRDNITIRINPDDAQSVDRLKEGLEKAFGKLNNLNFEPSNQVDRGCCQVETEWNAIDASIDAQLEGIYHSLMGKTLGETK